MRRREFILLFAGAVAFPTSLRAQQATPSPKPKSPAEIAAAEVLAERNERCRRQAKEQKVTFLKRHRFFRNCTKNYQKAEPIER